ncbi:MAG: hypothetical protein IJ108_06120 [Eubacterium sp.]|nr:hypothetical protein [Eubacterium sp.]
MRNNLLKKCVLSILTPAVAAALLAGCSSTGTTSDSAAKENSFHNASFSLESEDIEYDEATFNGMTFEALTDWRVGEDNGDTIYYPTDDDTDCIRVHEGSADQEYENQQELVNAIFDELMNERIDAGCFMESHDLNIAGHRGKWYRMDANFIDEDGQPIAGYEIDESMNGYLKECVIFASNTKDYVYLEATYPMGSATEDLFGRFYKSPHYHR